MVNNYACFRAWKTGKIVMDSVKKCELCESNNAEVVRVRTIIDNVVETDETCKSLCFECVSSSIRASLAFLRRRYESVRMIIRKNTITVRCNDKKRIE
ncbi:MAG: hypothetical protein BWX59_01079 [Bacteroidetes bacterium ADurb.Bin028]|nr:MAG: hypothetical protein BWX59_01079 [Bacteroidetes bacterium ADurb.Bin028]